MSDPAFVTTRRDIVYENRWMRLREDVIVRPDGREGLYAVVEKSDFAVVAPIENGRVTLVRQYRYPVQEACWEFPQGASGTGETDLAKVAAAELREEAGLAARTLARIGRLYPAYGYATVAFELFLASGLHAVGAQPEPEEYGMEARDFAIEDFIRMIRAGEIKDASTVAACFLLQLHGHLDANAPR